MQGFKTILVALLSIAGMVGAKYGFDLPVEDQTELATYIMGAVMIVMRVVTKGPVKLPGGEPNTLKSPALAGLLLLGLVVLSGCSQLAQRAESQDLTLTIAVQVATLRYVENDEGGADTAKIARVYDHAVALRDYLDKDTAVTIDDLQDYLNSRINYTELSLSEQVAARTFIQVLTDYLKAKADELENTSDSLRRGRVVAYYVIDTVIDTLEPYQA